MNDKVETIRVSVRNLVEFLYREGDITSLGSGIRNTEAMQLGSKIHRKIQKSMGLGYEAEVSLFTLREIYSEEWEESFYLKIEGRADGIYRAGKTVLVDEIKGVYLDVGELKRPIAVHKAQAMCYAYMVTEAEDLEEIEIQVTYCHLETEQIIRFNEVLKRKDIKDWFDNLLLQYKKWAIYEYDWKKKRDASIKELRFPFVYREGQKELAAMTYHAIADKKKLFIEAPTGVGKTITTVFPSVKAMGEGIGEKIFYLTAKTITRTVAEDCFSLLGEQDLFFKPLTITAKEKMCVKDKISCNPAECERAKGHYDRVNEAVYDMLINESSLTRDIIRMYADKHRVCPFEMGLDAAVYADAIICDYNYVFDPNVYLKRFFSTEKKSDAIILVDEAHNLVERGREMYSARLVKEDFLAVKRVVKAVRRQEKRPEVEYSLRIFEKSLESVNRHLLEWKQECDDFKVIKEVGSLEFQLLRVIGNYELFAKEYPVLPEREMIVNWYFTLRHFLAMLERMDEHYQIYLDYDRERRFRVKLQCMDPSHCLKNVMERVRSTILFSATLLPVGYYKEQLGGAKEDMAVYAKSAFLPEQRKVLIAKDATSKYTRRGAKEYRKIASYIENFVSAKQGNYLLFFPSYSFMDEVILQLKNVKGWRLLVQSADMREKEREDFLAAFNVDTKESVVGCCVMGGIFSEGIDLRAERLIGAVVVGTGLPMVCHERELFKDYFEEKKGRGFDYAYLYPGINKVFQAGGRVIRTIEDKGAILLLDERFLGRQYRDLFPREWLPYEVVDANEMKGVLRRFWKEEE